MPSTLTHARATYARLGSRPHNADMKRLTTVSLLAAGALVYASDPRAAVHEYLVLPSMRKIYADAEDAHVSAINIMKLPFGPKLPKNWIQSLDPKKQLEVTLFSKSPTPGVAPLTLKSPVGLAAGVDKNGDAIDSLFGYGFSWVEVGSVTPKPQPGNPKPRVFRLPQDQAVINRYGFNSDGHASVLARLLIRSRSTPRAPEDSVLALNLGKNKDGDETEDYVRGVRTFGPVSDVLVVNVSSPNTPGLRDLQADHKLQSLLTRLVEERNNLKLDQLPPLVVKIAPDLSESQIKAMSLAIKASRVDGVIIGNTTIQRPETLKSNTELTRQMGGLSGAPVKKLELKALRTLRAELPDLTIIGCGGISSGKDALEFREAGADYVQINTGFVYKGPGTAAHVTEEILEGLGDAKW